MRVLVTGGLGNVGRGCLAELLAQKHEVTCFDLKTRANASNARSFTSRVNLLWGDLRQVGDVAAAVKGQEVVIHAAFILPPASDDRPEFAEAVNVGGTRNVIEACRPLLRDPGSSSSLHSASTGRVSTGCRPELFSIPYNRWITTTATRWNARQWSGSPAWTGRSSA